MSSTALATLSEKHKSLAAQLEKNRERIAQVIPAGCGLAPTRAIAVVLDAMVRNPALLECTPSSIVRSVTAAAEVGLELASPHQHAFLVPFWNSRRQVKEATMMIGYRGFVHLIRGAPNVAIVQSNLVREQDEFDVDEGENKIIHRRPKNMRDKERGPITFCYARVIYSNSFQQFEVMDRDDLDKIRTSAKATRSDSPWNTHTDEMYKKCPLRRMAKWLELTQTARRAAELDAFQATVRGELPGLARDGFTAGRADELKAMLSTQATGAAEVVEGEIEE